MGRRKNSKGLIFIALGMGLLISLILPAKAVIVILAIAIVVCGIFLCKGKGRNLLEGSCYEKSEIFRWNITKNFWNQ